MSYYLKHYQNNLWHGKFAIFPPETVIHAISTRQGGQSKKPFDSLNMALHVADNESDVLANRRLFAHSLGLDPRKIVTTNQVHGAAVKRVTAADAGRGSLAYDDAIPETDALITDEPGLPLMLCFADCTPLMFLDPAHMAIGIAHAGWKGTVNKIGLKTVRRMGEEFGTDPAEVLAAIAPSIGACCYEVGENVIEAARSAFADRADELLSRRDGKTYFDLWQANRRTLLEAGLVETNIEMANTCTSCEHQWYFSYRADGKDTGRIAAMMAIREMC